MKGEEVDHSSKQTQDQYITDEETRTAAAALELLWETEDPAAADGTQTPPGEAAHFEGMGLMDKIRSFLKKKKGTHSHHTMQQVTVDAPASSITAVPIQHIPWAKDIADDLINLQLRPGSPNTLVMAASELIGSHGRGGRSGKREPWPPAESRALTNITGSTPSGSGVAARKDGEEADILEPGVSQLTAVVSEESDFAASQHQMIPTGKCFGLPVVPRQSGGFELDYKDAFEVTNFRGIYYFELGYLRPGYTNAMPYDHPLDQQGHTASALQLGVTAYSWYIGLIALGILLP